MAELCNSVGCNHNGLYRMRKIFEISPFFRIRKNLRGDRRERYKISLNVSNELVSALAFIEIMSKKGILINEPLRDQI